MRWKTEGEIVMNKEKKTKFSVLIVALLLVMILLVGCSTKEPVANDNSTKQESELVKVDDSEQETKDEEDGETVAETENTDNKQEIDETAENETEMEISEPDEMIDDSSDIIDVEEEEELTTPQRNSVNMLNYITVLTQEINSSKNSRIYLDSVQSSLSNNMDYDAIDSKTQGQINNLWRTIDSYKMIEVKRERLDYLYEQNKAQALRSAIPNPVGLLSAAQPGGLLKTAASVLYMAVDSKTSYESAVAQADLKHLQDNWELDDSEAKELSNSQLTLLNYMIEMARDNGIRTEYTLNPDSVSDFVEWIGKDNLVSKIAWLESHEDVYKEFRTYWLVLAESYYNCGTNSDYEKCLGAMEKYEEVATKIFRKDYDYAKTLPMAIIAAKEIKSEEQYVEYADKYVKEIVNNCDDEEWALRYFAAQICIDLYGITKDGSYLDEAYDIAHENVNMLMYEQKDLNEAYLAPVKKAENQEGYTKRQKQEVKDYNKLLDEKREIELPPVSEAFYLNCDLLFALAEEKNIALSEKKDIDKILHGEDLSQNIFLTEALDNRYWASENVSEISSDEIKVEFDGEKIVIPASCITDRSEIKVTISGGEILDDWTVTKVKRPKNSKSCSEFMVTLTSKEGKKYKYTAGEKITITVTPVVDTPDEVITFKYDVNSKKTLGILKGIEIERVK